MERRPAVLKGALIVVASHDKDQPGHRRAAEVVASLRAADGHPMLVQAREGKDAYDHLPAGHGRWSSSGPSRKGPHRNARRRLTCWWTRTP
jgi:hypothetical protein